MGRQRLYEVQVTFSYYAQAENETQAEEFAAKAWDDAGPDKVEVVRVMYSDHPLQWPWTEDCAVYGAEPEVELGTLLDRLPQSPPPPQEE